MDKENTAECSPITCDSLFNCTNDLIDLLSEKIYPVLCCKWAEEGHLEEKSESPVINRIRNVNARLSLLIDLIRL